MTGWPAVVTIIVLEFATAVIAVRLAVRRWWDSLYVAILALALVPAFAKHVTGDISRVLPYFVWSEGSDGKDQIVDVGIASTVFLPSITAALIVVVLKWAWTVGRPPD